MLCVVLAMSFTDTSGATERQPRSWPRAQGCTCRVRVRKARRTLDVPVILDGPRALTAPLRANRDGAISSRCGAGQVLSSGPGDAPTW